MKKLLKQLNNRLLFYLVAALLLFIPLYPKLPAVGVTNTWVYIRIEDFLIAVTTVLFLIQLKRKKIGVYSPLGIPIALYWTVGFFSLINSLIFIAPHLANFFPHVAVLSFLRRIEYMTLFFIGYAVVKEEKDARKLFWVLAAAATGILLYGIGQRYYINLWAAFPAFFEKYSFCFPSFQTTNEEFAKGIPLCLPLDGRITSTFGGHYDLSAYLVLIIPLIFSVALILKKKIQQLFLFLLGIGLVYVLILTASRISFAAYVVGIIFALSFIKKKLFLIPILLISIIFLLTSSSSVLQRFAQTFRFTNLVLNNQGQVIGETLNKLPDELRNKISKEPFILEALPPTQELPSGSSYIAFPGNTTSTSSAFLKSSPNLTAAQKSKYKFGAVEISNIQGNFLIQRALVYDISFTTRFQGEWPNSWHAFERNYLLGSGYSSITLSSDNSFLRSLGEVGVLGFLSFFSFFLIWYIYLKKGLTDSISFEKVFALGLSGGIIGLFINAILIDVFEASKVAESMWLLLGIGAGGIALSGQPAISYLKEIKKVLTSQIFIISYLLILFFVYLSSSFDNFFVGDDFSWLRWTAQSNSHTLIANFSDAQGFFLRPIPKLLIFLEYTLFNFKPFAYHVFNLFYNFGVSVAVYFMLFAIFKKKRVAFLGAFVFSFIPFHSQDLFWTATISTTVSSLFIMFGLLCFYFARIKRTWILYTLSFILFFLSVFSYENAVIFIGLMVVIDLFLMEKKYIRNKLRLLAPYIVSMGIILLYVIVRLNSHAAGFSGDYNYNLLKVLPNSIGNYFGYIALFFASESSLSFYTLLRTSLKTYSVLLTVLGALVVAFIGGFFIEHKEKIHISKSTKIFIFGFVFSVVALLPYLALGNITLRYGYLASFGFIVMLLVLLETILSRIKEKNNLYAYAGVGIAIAVLCFMGLQSAEQYWDQASKITYDTLVRFRLDYPIQNKTNVYFYNIPIKTGEAYIFPVGLPDAIYFVNNDKSVNTYIVKDKATAQLLEKSVPKTVWYTYIFTFDKNMYLLKVDARDTRKK